MEFLRLEKLATLVERPDYLYLLPKENRLCAFFLMFIKVCFASKSCFLYFIFFNILKIIIIVFCYSLQYCLHYCFPISSVVVDGISLNAIP